MKTYQNPNTSILDVQLINNICGVSNYGSGEGGIDNEGGGNPFAPARKLYI